MSERIYVGYLPLTAGQRRFVFVAAAFVLAFLLGVGAAVVSGSRDPGDGQWITEPIAEYEGVVRLLPYPVLATRDADGRVVSRPVVEQGKIGSQARLSPLVGQRVRLRGSLLTRHGFEMIELAAGASAIEALAAPAERANADEASPVEVSLVGEIVDFKCYLGAMKPGEGRTHKACAILCLRGGIPAYLVVAGEGGAKRAIMLADANGRDNPSGLLTLVGEPVEVSGSLRRVDDVEVMWVSGVRAKR